MKKAVRNVLIIGASVFAAGVLIFIIGMSAIKWDFTRLDATEYTERSYSAAESDEEITSIDIDVSSFAVEIKSGDAVSLDYYEASDSEVTVAAENGVLKIIEKREAKNWFIRGIFGVGRMDKKYVLTVPSGLPLGVKGNSTRITLSGIETEKLDVDCTNASLLLSDCKIAAINIDSTNLTVVVDDTVVTELKVCATNTSIRAKSSQLHSVIADGTNFTVDFTDAVCGAFMADGTNITCKFDSVSVDTLALDGTNVKAKLEIKGDRSEYTVVTDGETEQVGSTDKRLAFDGTNIRLELDFV